jgi:hypothetical protein
MVGRLCMRVLDRAKKVLELVHLGRPDQATMGPGTPIRTRVLRETKSMEPRQARKLSREEFEKVSSEIRALVGDGLWDHKDGDVEMLLLRKRRSGSSNSDL